MSSCGPTPAPSALPLAAFEHLTALYGSTSEILREHAGQSAGAQFAPAEPIFRSQKVKGRPKLAAGRPNRPSGSGSGLSPCGIGLQGDNNRWISKQALTATNSLCLLGRLLYFCLRRERRLSQPPRIYFFPGGGKMPRFWHAPILPAPALESGRLLQVPDDRRACIDDARNDLAPPVPWGRSAWETSRPAF